MRLKTLIKLKYGFSITDKLRDNVKIEFSYNNDTIKWSHITCEIDIRQKNTITHQSHCFFHSNIGEYDTKPKENNKYYKDTN